MKDCRITAMLALLLVCTLFTGLVALTAGAAYAAAPEIEFTELERQYIASRGPVEVLCCEEWSPLMFKGEEGEPAGVLADMAELISAKSGLEFSYKWAPSNAAALDAVQSGHSDVKCGMVSGGNVHELSAYFTRHYLVLELMLVGGPGVAEGERRIGTVSRYSGYDVIHGDNVEYVYFQSSEECFKALDRGEVDEIIVNSFASGFYHSQTKYGSYMYTPLQGESSSICMAVRGDDKLLCSILDKAILAIDNGERNSIIVKNTLEAGNSLIALLNRIPTVTVIIIFAVFIGSLLVATMFVSRYMRKTREAKEAIERANKRLITDELTGLLNERGFASLARETLEMFPDQKWFIVDFDIDCFEHFNAAKGFTRGNAILRAIAEVTRNACIYPGELCARVYADHFVCIATAQSTDQLRERALAGNAAFRSATGNLSILLNYGIYEIADLTEDVSIMCDRALSAKRTVKGSYGNIIGIYDEELHRQQIEDSELVAYMETALNNGEFVAYYQPKYDIQSEKIAGAEALARWKHPKGDITPPDRFIKLFEKNGLIDKLDMYILEVVCKKLREQIDAGLRAVPVSVNFSRNHLYDDGFVHQLTSTLERYDIAPSCIEVEFTETTFFENGQRLVSVIEALHNAGLLVSIDDFGSGFSSLNMLKDIKFDIVKLDRGFLDVTTTSQRGKTVISSVLSLARELRLSTVAEGVETREQLEFLRENGCDMVQGFFFSGPVPAEEYDRILAGERV
ncbi:MAG: EAL domain-containing protein [Syntrophomonadaceae bacterium]|nr:EAL domain-containing protein [Syntrophomonadaceae bacterium]